MSKAITIILVFTLGMLLAGIVVTSVRISWQWLLLVPAAIALFLTYQKLSEHPGMKRDFMDMDTPLIGSKGGSAIRPGEYYEEDDDEE